MPTSCRCPPWLQTALAEMEERVREAKLDAAAPPPDTFGQRAESYYRKRPQLITLIHDLHKSYIYLADRYSRCKPTVPDLDDESSSDAESSLSFQFQQTASSSGANLGEVDLLVAELVTATVEKEMLMLEMIEREEVSSESTRKIELQRSLLEVLESERTVLMGENVRLGYRAQAAEEAAREMAADAAYMGRKAGEMARVVVKLRGERSACMLGGRIGGLQAQIYGLERRNRELVEAMGMGEKERAEAEVELEMVRLENRRLRETAEGCRRRRRGWWWSRVRKIDRVVCGPHVTGCKE